MRKTDLKEYSESEVMKNVHASSKHREPTRKLLCFEIEQNANAEEFIPQPAAIEEQPKQPTVAEVVKTAEKEPVPAAEPVETEIPSFMSQEEM